MSSPIILIPARMAASRLPGKPMADIHGEPMIVHVWRRARAADIGPVVVATDAPEIAERIEAAGGRAVMTRADHPSGSDRIHQALLAIDPRRHHDIVVNVQGDLPTVSAKTIRAVLTPMTDNAVDIATLVAEIVRAEEREAPSVVKMVGTEITPGHFRALYFSRRDGAVGRWAPLPSYRALCLSPRGA